MQIYKYTETDQNESTAIIYNSDKDRWELTSGYDVICILKINQEEYFKIESGDISSFVKSINEELNLTHESYVFSCHSQDSKIGTTESFHCSVKLPKKSIELPYGVFKIHQSGRTGETFFKRMPEEEKKPLLVNSTDLTVYMEEIKKGNGKRKNKKGVLLFGPPGTGKTSSIFSLREYCTEANRTRMFFISNKVYLSELSDLRDLFKNDYTIFVFEEVTERLEKFGAEDILTFLDGENSWNNSLNIATSNYPEQLPSNIVDRPGRFDTFIELSYPTSDNIQDLAKAFGINEEVDFLFNKKLSYDYISFLFDQSIKKGDTVKVTFEKENQ
jgi:ATPase family associated with various cellular activities (AAA)